MIEITDEMIVAFEEAYDEPGITGGDTRAGLAAVFAIVEREHRVTPMGPKMCCATWDNDELAGLPHRCIVRLGWHIVHACHCGASRRVTDNEHVQIARGQQPTDPTRDQSDGAS